MNRDSIFLLPEGCGGTFDKDESLPPLPLPKLDETVERYFESLKPFGNEAELKNSRHLLDDFLQGDGPKLQEILEAKATETKNWMEKWWEDYAYLKIRTPLSPTCLMGSAMQGKAFGIPETPEHFLKTAALILHATATCWSWIYEERLRPTTNPAGTVVFTSANLVRVFNACRQPGVEIDEVKAYFKRKHEGKPPSHMVITGRGRFFVIDVLYSDGTILSIQDFHRQLELINASLLKEETVPSVAFLTQDERTNWAHNRQRLLEISPQNKETLLLIESSIYVYAIEDRIPETYSQTAQMTLNAGQCCWADKSANGQIFRNGRMSFFGEHCCYDGSISTVINYFFMLSTKEGLNINWDEGLKLEPTLREIKFDTDDKLSDEIGRLETIYKETMLDIAVIMRSYQNYGKEFMKKLRVHPDAYMQAVIQLTYHRLHTRIGSCYESAVMREYYNGRTETVRSCDTTMLEMCESWGNATDIQKLTLFRGAAESQMKLMNAARQGKGVDRHLMGLQCAALENNIPVPRIFTDDPLYPRSGGGGNFVLSTSTLGFTIVLGLVAPMIRDGYGFFYSILSDAIWFNLTAFSKSSVTDVDKFSAAFDEVMDEVKVVFDRVSDEMGK